MLLYICIYLFFPLYSIGIHSQEEHNPRSLEARSSTLSNKLPRSLDGTKHQEDSLQRRMALAFGPSKSFEPSHLDYR